MRRTLTLAALACLALGAISISFVKDGWTQVGYLVGIRLQSTTPGVQDIGHGNISGTMRAGQFVGGGAGLTNVDAQTLDGLNSTAFAQLTGTNTWTGANTFIHGGSSFRGDGGGLNSVNADRLDGLDSTAFLQSVPVPLTLVGSSASHIIRGENTSAAGGVSGVYGVTTSLSGVNFGVFGRSASTSGYGVAGVASASSGTTYGVYGENSSMSGTAIYGTALAGSGTTSGGFFQSASTSGRGVYGVATATSGDTYGGLFESASTTGRGVYGLATSATGGSYGVFGQTNSTSGRGVYGYATASSGTTYGVWGQNDSASGNGVFGKATSASGPCTGGWFESDSTIGVGVLGLADATSGGTFGVQGVSNSPSGRGVYGLATALSGGAYGVEGVSDSPSGRGVYGHATASSGTIYGVLGEASTSAAGYAVFALGDMGATGTKPFRIDHPFDPENKYLLHYAAESPMPQNFYVGNVVTDANGYAWVELPDYFAEINTNFKYQLTVVDDADSDGFVIAKVSKKIRGNRFQIRTSAPNVEVSWEVKADRNDLYVQKKQPKDVVEKQGPERGKYQHPELYVMPMEMGMDYTPPKPKSGANSARVGLGKRRS